LAALLLILIMLSGCVLLPKEEELLAPDLLRPEEITYRTVEVERGTIQNIISGTATTSSAVFYELTFNNRSGYLAELEARLAMVVEEGEMLARLDTGTLDLDIRRQQITVERAQLSRDEAKKSGSRVALRFAELDLEYHMLTLQHLEEEYERSTIVAPVNGQIVYMGEYKIGEYVPGRQVVATLADPSFIQFEYTGTDVTQMRLGMEGTIKLGELEIPARISMTPLNVPTAEYDRYRNTVIFTVDDQSLIPENTRIGSWVRFNVLVEEKHDVILIPREAAQMFMGQYYAQILEDGILIERDLSIGIRSDTHLEVLQGLEEGDLLVVGIDR